MTWTIFWSRFAELELSEIHSYYADKANIKVANKIITDILKAPSVLIQNPELGP